MSRLAQLKIQGIRSFDSKDKGQMIRFETPLTLIVGQNGSGKTTIIECLKYAFTGIQPPNTKVGGAFVHDPKLDSVAQVKAMVQVSFRSAEGSALTVSRRLELNVKKASRSLKTLESSLVVTRHGERSVISSRVAELDVILPKYLGVSTAVIDNVIFCHQDESFWPLSDPATLKKKFDEIFEAQKYTKAITNIKDIAKAQKIELDKYKMLEAQAKVDKDRAINTQRRADRLLEEIKELRKKSEDLKQRFADAAKMAEEKWERGAEYTKILGTLEGKRIEAQSKQSIIEDLETYLEVVAETDESLQTTLAQFDARQAELHNDAREKKGEYLEQEDQLKSLGKQREEQVRLKGKYEEEKEAHERQLARRKGMVREVAVKHQIREYEYLEDENQVEEFLTKIRKISKQQKEVLDRAKHEHGMQRRDAQSQVNKLTERKTALRDQRATARKQMDINDREAADFQRKVDQIAVDEGNKAVAESRLEDLNKQLEKAQQDAQKADWDSKIQKTNAELRDLQGVSSRLNAEMVQSTKKAGELARLSHLKQEMKERQKRLDTLLTAHRDRITALLGEERAWDADTVEELHQEVLKHAADEVITAERKRDGVSRELEQLQFKQNAVRKELARKRTEAENCDKQIRAVVGQGPEGYDEALEKAEEKVQEARQDSSGFNGVHDYFLRVLETANHEEKPACRTCRRAFKLDSEALAIFKRRVQDLIADWEAKAVQNDPSAAEAAYKRMLDLGAVRDAWRKLVESEIPVAEKDLKDLDSQRHLLLSTLEDHDKTVVQKQQVKRDLESISQTVASINKCDDEVKNLNTQIEELSAKKSQQSAGRTLEEIQEEQDATVANIEGAQNVISRLRSEQEQSRATVSGMEIESRDLMSKLVNIEHQLEKKATLAARVAEFRAMNQKQKDTIENITAEMEKLDPQISTAQVKYDDIDQRATAKEREISDELSKLSDSINNLDILNGQIQSFIDRDGPNQLPQVNRELKHLEQQIDTLQNEHKRLTSDINKINDRIKDGETTRRRYSDNVRHRQETRAVARLREEIKELESHNAEVDRDRLTQEARKYEEKRNNLSAQQSGVMGEMKSKDVQLTEIEADFQQNMKDAPQRYKKEHIKVETTKAAVEDLGRYGGALDKAIMKYHSLKMDEINTIIEELWRKTYRGTDVDTIMIKAENEQARSNRSYNYRVVMVKRGAEMDMRGRCSAGQKVLASIIIRLALAECFSSNCGLITLDEPTTNLDRDNIESLAQSLKEIIEYRQQQSNFQLVVITHDEDFLRQMECSKFAGSYYRVSRDTAQNSVLTKQSIAEVL
ncbi:DNA repair protein rad50 [Cladophialophora chaetospira]|uniref:DNA repair protein RAD50 n=1 Tax=Cladophialophora chaetospira TaxID=386627 RepID=A0AA38XNF3_9EURO|nr:DNA repair protein rad50 [Cladophialophora chaetospira]